MVLSNHTKKTQIPGDFFSFWPRKEMRNKDNLRQDPVLSPDCHKTSCAVWDNSMYFICSLRVQKDESVPYLYIKNHPCTLHFSLLIAELLRCFSIWIFPLFLLIMGKDWFYLQNSSLVQLGRDHRVIWVIPQLRSVSRWLWNILRGRLQPLSALCSSAQSLHRELLPCVQVPAHCWDHQAQPFFRYFCIFIRSSLNFLTIPPSAAGKSLQMFGSQAGSNS